MKSDKVVLYLKIIQENARQYRIMRYLYVHIYSNIFNLIPGNGFKFMNFIS